MTNELCHIHRECLIEQKQLNSDFADLVLITFSFSGVEEKKKKPIQEAMFQYRLVLSVFGGSCSVKRHFDKILLSDLRDGALEGLITIMGSLA